MLSDIPEFASGSDIREGLRKGFLGLDAKLQTGGGLEVVADMKRKNPPNKSALMKVLTETTKKDSDGGPSDESLMLDSIGCTANVVLLDW